MAQAHAAYGQFLAQTGDAAGAVASIRQALAYDPTWVTLRVEYARALVAAGDLMAAEREIDAAAKLLPPSPRVELVRGDVLAARGDAAGARAAWQRGLQLAPGDADLERRLGGR
jgi:Flp pilus assembly protein TadD